MDRLRQLLFKLRALWRGRGVDAEMAEEMRAHLDRLVAANRAAGMAPDEARHRALRQFGNMSSLEERALDERRFRWLESLVRDLRFGLRQLRLNPGFATTAIVSLALGIGASTAIFSAVDVILFRPLPFPHADHLSIVRKGPRTGEPAGGIAPANALEMVERVRPFADASAFTTTQFVVRQGSGAERVAGVRVGSTFFITLGVTPALGRDFTPSDDRFGAERVAIISSGLWQRAFATDPHVVGRTLDAGALRLTVIGVMPESFRFPELFGPTFKPEIWTPLAFPPDEGAMRGAGYMSLLLKRRDGWQWEAVQRELDLIARAYEKLEPTNYGQEQLRAMPLRQLVIGDTRATLMLLWAAVTCLLLVACANTANLVLSRSAARSRELAVRASIGASRARLFSQLVAESALLSVIASALGLLLAWVLLAAARDVLRDFLPRVDEIAIGWRVVAFTIGASWVTSLAVGLIPAQRLSAITPRDALNRAGSRGSVDGPWATSLRRALLVGQIAAAVLLGTTAALLGRSLGAVLRADLGFQPESLLTFELSIPEGAVPKAQVTALYAELTDRLEARPEVTSVGALNLLPLSGGGFGWGFLVGDRPLPPGTALPSADVRIVTPGTLEALGVALREGRSFDRGDASGGQPVAIVNETFARRVWPGENPIGRQIKLAGPVDFVPWMTVIGVAKDVRFGSPDLPAAPAIYRPLGQHAWRDMAVVVRTIGPAAHVAPAVRQEVERLGRGIAVLAVREFEYYQSRSVAGRRLVTTLVGVFAGTSLFVALVGVYGLFAYAVTSRTREIGVRLALGATRSRVVWMLMRDALLLGGVGIAVGTAGVFSTRRLIQTQLFEMQATDPPTMVFVSAVVIVTALVACYLPSRQAAFVDPTHALRAE
jgi:putative ABC transport system permease protein